MVRCADRRSGVLAHAIARGSLAGVVLAGLALTASAQPTRHVDEANHFEAQIPPGWYPIRQPLLDAVPGRREERIQNKRFRRGGRLRQLSDATRSLQPE